MEKKTIELLVSHLVAMNSILQKETPKEEIKISPLTKVWEVYWLDETWILDRSTLRTYAHWEDAYKYYCELAKNTMEAYKKNNKDLLCGFNKTTYYLDNRYPEFWIDNKKNWNCHMWYEYEECVLQESFIM